MPVRKYKPTSPGRRFGSVLDFKEITKTEPEKSLLAPLKKTGGRNNLGRMTQRRRGGGAKRQYRLIDFRRNKDGVPGKVVGVEYDPNRTANIALVQYADGEKRYILAPKGITVGAPIESGERVEPSIGNTMPLANIPLGLEVHNVEMRPGSGGKLVRTAGAAARLSAREGEYAVLILPSGELRKVHVRCRATIGQVGNLDHQNTKLGKAGRARHMGHRPKVRGVAQNPISHPMGGGEGRSSGGRHPCSPTGILAKGGKTRKRKNRSDKFIIRRRKKR
ncbi:MAG: 50S ribosomal protein L2 [Planctomycetes bacterium]|nr:50S ribosomal protein L2 [Planctomycetota bacterium]